MLQLTTLQIHLLNWQQIKLQIDKRKQSKASGTGTNIKVSEHKFLYKVRKNFTVPLTFLQHPQLYGHMPFYFVCMIEMQGNVANDAKINKISLTRSG